MSLPKRVARRRERRLAVNLAQVFPVPLGGSGRDRLARGRRPGAAWPPRAESTTNQTPAKKMTRPLGRCHVRTGAEGRESAMDGTGGLVIFLV